MIDRLRRDRRDGNDLYFLDRAASLVGERWPDYGDAARRAREHLYDHVPALEDPDLLLRWLLPDGKKADLWCRIPEGVGWVGKRDDEDGNPWESPRHQVKVARPFWLSAIPITNALYQLFDDSKRFHPWKGVSGAALAEHPRVDVTWYEAVSFCRWLSRQPGFEATSPSLPEEEVWEYACRAGSETRFWRGNDDKDLDAVGWFDGNSGRRTHRVARKPANELGLYDLHGNVWEWTATEWDEKRYKSREGKVHPVDLAASSADLAGGATAGGATAGGATAGGATAGGATGGATAGGATAGGPRVRRVVRGGGFIDAAQWCRSACRDHGDPWLVVWSRGFRVLLSSAPSRP